MLLHSFLLSHASHAAEAASEKLRTDLGSSSYCSHKLRQGANLVRAERTQTIVMIEVVERNPKLFVTSIITALGIGVEMLTDKITNSAAEIRLHAVVCVCDVISEMLQGESRELKVNSDLNSFGELMI